MLIFSFVSAIIIYLLWKSMKKPKGFPPGPPKWPIIGGFLHMIGNKSDPSLFHGSRMARKKYGDVFGFYLGRTPVVMIADFDLLKQLFKLEEASSRPPSRPMNELRVGHELEELGGERSPGIPLSDGRYWWEQRRFVFKHLREFSFRKSSMEDMLIAEVEKLCKWYQHRVGKTLVMNRTMNVSVVNSLWTIMVGDSFQLDDPHLLRLAAIMEQTSTLITPLAFVLPHPAMVKFPFIRKFSGFDNTKLMIEAVNDLIGPYIEEHQRTFQRDHPRDLMDLIIQENQDATDQGSPFFGSKVKAVLHNMFLDMFLAGMEAVSSSLQWTFLYLVHHPEVQEKVHEELDLICGRDRLPTLSDQQSTPYTNAVLHESLRITGLAYNGVPHYTTQAMRVDRFIIPRGAIVFGLQHHIMNDVNYWDDPDVFRPERFIDGDTGKFVPSERVIPFGTGKRICLGQSLGEKELFLFFAGILQRFQMSPDPKEKLPGYGFEEKSNSIDGANTLRVPPTFKVVLKSRI